MSVVKAVLLVGCLYAVSGAVPSVVYTELDYTFTQRGNDTTMTGVRSVNDSSSLVYMSGFTWINFETDSEGRHTNYGAYMYRGDITGDGEWYGNFYYPSSPGANVTGTFFYGPCGGSESGLSDIPDVENFFQVVGDYETAQGGLAQYGLLFQGYLNGTGEWKQLDPTPLIANDNPPTEVIGTIGHSTMGGVAVGNFITQAEPQRFRTFIYSILEDTYVELYYTDESGQIKPGYSITAYCIWHNKGTPIYSIAGGIGKGGVEDGFIVDYNATSKTAFDWRMFHHENSTVTHFQGMWPDFANQGVGYSFSANWVSLLTGDRGTSFVYVSNISSPDRSTDNVNYYEFHFPDTINNSANSVYYNTTVAFFETPEEIYAHGFVAQFDFSGDIVVDDDTTTDSDGGSNSILSRDGVIAVSVVGAFVGVALLLGIGYFAFGSSSTAGGAAAVSESNAVNPMSNSVHSGVALSSGSSASFQA